MSDEISLEEIQEANDLLRGIPVVEIQPPATQLIRNDRGDYYRGESPAWIKLSTAFRDDLSKLKGCKLAVFICACLHISERGDSFPAMRMICIETGYELAAVSRAIRELESMGMMKIDRRRGEVNHYHPVFAAYGHSTPQKRTGHSTPQKRRPVPPKSEVVPPIKSEHEVEPIKKNQEEDLRASARTELRELDLLFAELTGLSIPTSKTDKEKRADGQSWYQPMRRMQALANGQMAETLRIAVHQMRKDGLTISAPRSVENVFKSIYALKVLPAFVPVKVYE